MIKFNERLNFVLEMSKKLGGFIDDDSDDDDFEPKKTKPLKKRTAVDADGDDFASKKQKKRKLKDEASHKTSTQDGVGSKTTTTTGIHQYTFSNRFQCASVDFALSL